MYSTGILLLAAALGVSAKLYPDEKKMNHTCAITNDDNVLSCSPITNNHDAVDSCCVETFGGLFLSTQFWDTYTGLEDQGQLLPANTWGLHGLWPDFCNGSYTQYCDLNRQYDPSPSHTTNFPRPGTIVPAYNGTAPVAGFIEDFGRYDLLDYMNTYWINQGAPNVNFWAHEFSKHATCYSTFDVPCYGPKYRAHEEVVEFYETAIMYYRRFPTFDWLKQASITPSNTTTYSLSDIQAQLTKKSGGVPYLGCSGPAYNSTHAGSLDNGRTDLDEVWYYMHLFGRPQDGHAVHINATLPNTSCATTPGAINYYERTPSSERTPKAVSKTDF